MTDAFADLDAYVALPRMGGLISSPDGTRLAVSVARVSTDGTGYVSSMWEIDPTGEQPARRLTRGAKGESAAAFTRDNDLLFTSRRGDPDAESPDEDDAPLWCLPAAGGEARMVASRPAGFSRVLRAADADVLILGSSVLPGSNDLDVDDRQRTARKKAKVTAVLHTGYPVRFWDHDLGPDQPHWLTGTAAQDGQLALQTVTAAPGAALVEPDADLSADGRSVVSTWNRSAGGADLRVGLMMIDTTDGSRRTLLQDPDADLLHPRFSPTADRIAYGRETISTPELAPRVTLAVVAADGSGARELTAEWDRWPTEVAWLPDGAGLLVTADQQGNGPIFVVDAETGAVQQLTEEPATFSNLVVAPDGSAVYALRASYLAPPHPVRVELIGEHRGHVTALPAPASIPELPGTLTEVTATAADGAPLRAYLALPTGCDPDSPAPLLLWVHGGPLGSWNAWSWRWNPWIMVAAGYAVLLPDPALSTGYGQEFIQRGWGAWGAAPFTDLMAVTDAAIERADIDDTRVGCMGGSFGGYMANWIAGHTDRFSAIVTHASLWALEDFGGTTDAGYYWARELSPERAQEFSPHRSVADIVTPMLVIHGDKDYRVPIGQGQRLWFDLLESSALAVDDHGHTPHRFLYFPTENHWVLTPQHAHLWYEVVLGFLAEHVLGTPAAALPPLLGGPS